MNAPRCCLGVGMDKPEARELLTAKLDEYRQVPYALLAARVGEQECHEVTGPSGMKYQIEIEVRWDHKPNDAIRVLGAIDDGRLRVAFCPLCEDLIVTPSS